MNPLKCDVCGKFISFADIAVGGAKHELLTPDSDLSTEEYNTECAQCVIRRAEEKVYTGDLDVPDI